MIFLRTPSQIALMKKANRIVKDTLDLLIENTKEGISTYKLNQLAHDYIISQKAQPSFLNYNGFPMSICVSIDCEIIHGIPSKKRILCEGQVVSFDVGVVLDGWHGDAARTVGVGIISDKCQRLIDTAEQSFFAGVKSIVPNESRLGDLGAEIEKFVVSRGFGLVRTHCGHGIGRALHEQPDVPNFGLRGHGQKIRSGMTLAIEPMLTMGGEEVDFMPDGTVKTLDRDYSAHYENTVAITENGVEILSI